MLSTDAIDGDVAKMVRSPQLGMLLLLSLVQAAVVVTDRYERVVPLFWHSNIAGVDAANDASGANTK